jgi:hypothetical protein
LLLSGEKLKSTYSKLLVPRIVLSFNFSNRAWTHGAVELMLEKGLLHLEEEAVLDSGFWDCSSELIVSVRLTFSFFGPGATSQTSCGGAEPNSSSDDSLLVMGV